MELRNTRRVLCVSLFFLVSFLSLNNVLRSEGAYGNETDRLGLLSIKALITSDPQGALGSWNRTLQHCQWDGVICGRRHQRVRTINLDSKRLVGSLSPHIANLTFLRLIYISNNFFSGEIPPQIDRLFRLRYLVLGNNSFSGEIPTNLSRCSDLRIIDLSHNKITGHIPDGLSFLPKLDTLRLGYNGLTGSIPRLLGNLSSLTDLSLTTNYLGGMIPSDLGRLARSESLSVSDNQIFGRVPSSVYNLSFLQVLGLSANKLHGNLPSDLGLTLPNLNELLVSGNRFVGPIPISLPNASRLASADFSWCDFSGPVPVNVGSLRDLSQLRMNVNQLGTGEGDDLNFLTSLNNCTRLQKLGFGRNNFKGRLPNSITNLSIHLTSLVLEGNQIYGKIPTRINDLLNLNILDVADNLLTGSIPLSIGKLQSLRELDLSRNNFLGEIPSSLGNITELLKLDLHGNQIGGSIPLSLTNCRDMLSLYLHQNNLTGTLSRQFVSLFPQLFDLNIAQNSLTGTLPFEVGNLTKLVLLDVSRNGFSGEIPSSLGNCLSLEQLYMAGNYFEGRIPSSLSSLHGLQYLDLSRNKFYGTIPEFLEKLPLQNLNLSHNDLEGKVPRDGVFGNASAFSVFGNKKLCGGITYLQLPACTVNASRRKSRSIFLRVIIPIAAGVLCLCMLSWLAVCCRQRKKSRSKPSSLSFMGRPHRKISYMELLKATNGFSSTNLIGVGSYGSVYKGILDHDGTVVAVKVLNLQLSGASKSFMVECKALRNVRHRNLINILTSCSSIDFRGNDFRALVFEFMANGSLDRWLHPTIDELQLSKTLGLIQRLNIAIDVASALDYLHNHCETPVIHCDLKPSNVLLDEDLNARVSDFGIARFLSKFMNDHSQNQSSSVPIRGTIGYIAPEYNMGSQVSAAGDVYSYGILLLEMFTAKRPTDAIFTDSLNLHIFVNMALPERVMEVIDPCLREEVEAEAMNNSENCSDARSRMEKCFVSVLGVGLSCSRELSRLRMNIGDAVKEMNMIRDVFLGVGFRGGS